ncbi:hypothetical protein MKW92_024856 [Papaver armeniacum]|nr:hypothetical protein MKW92_024856 [Papaver armeniacum]
MGSLARVTESEAVDDDVITPYNFSIVETGIYRCGFPPGFPEPCYFSFIESLNLRSIVCFCLEPYPEENVKFLQAHNIKLFQFGIQGGTVDPLAPPEDAMAKSIRKRRKNDMITEGLKVLLDDRNHPILIHCRHGNHRTGIVVGCYRKLKQNWSLPCVLEEYKRLSGETARQSDIKFIKNYEAHEIVDASS